MADSAYVEALRRERAGYVVRDMPDRVADVDAALTAAGAKADKKATPARETAVDSDPRVETATETPRRGRPPTRRDV